MQIEILFDVCRNHVVLAQPHCTSAKSGDSFRESPLLFELRRADVARTVRSMYASCTEEKFNKGGGSLVWPSGVALLHKYW